MQPQKSLKTNLLQPQQPHLQAQQNLTESPQKKAKKRMTSIKHPISPYKHTLTKIFCHYYPIKQNSTLDTKCQVQLGFLYIGGSGVVDQETLKKHDIKAVLTVLQFKKYDKQNLGQKIEDMIQIQQHQFIDLPDDHPDIGPYLNHSYDFISEYLGVGMNLLVHSGDGLSRAPAIVINYLMRKERISFDKAVQIVRERKPQICINENLTQQLKALKY